MVTTSISPGNRTSAAVHASPVAIPIAYSVRRVMTTQTRPLHRSAALTQPLLPAQRSTTLNTSAPTPTPTRSLPRASAPSNPPAAVPRLPTASTHGVHQQRITSMSFLPMETLAPSSSTPSAVSLHSQSTLIPLVSILKLLTTLTMKQPEECFSKRTTRLSQSTLTSSRVKYST